MTNRNLLTRGAGLLENFTSDPYLESGILLAYVNHMTREQLFAAHREVSTPDSEKRFLHLVYKRLSGLSIAAITGAKNFYTTSFITNTDVLIPRPETELLIDRALVVLRQIEKPSILDVGTGSGCIAITLAQHLRLAYITATDISKPALTVARKNALKNMVHDRINFLEGDLLLPVRKKYFSLVCANLPYLSTHEAYVLSKTDGEPPIALDGGSTGIELYETFLKQLRHISCDTLLMEIDPRQTKKISSLIYKQCSFERLSVVLT